MPRSNTLTAAGNGIRLLPPFVWGKEMADKASDDRIVAALIHARYHGTDSEIVNSKIAALTERVSNAQPLTTSVRQSKDDSVIEAAKLLLAGFTGVGPDRNYGAVEALIERLTKAQQLKTALEVCFQPATPDISALGPSSSNSNVGAAPQSPSAANSNFLPFLIFAIGVLILIFGGWWTNH